MSSLSLAVRDSSTMLRRNLLHARRYPSLTLNLLLTPVMLLLLFVYIFGDAMQDGGAGRDAATSRYIVPGILLMTIGSTTIGTAVSVSTDMSEGIIARFRTMAIHRSSILFGHVVGSVLQTLISVILVGAVGVAMGFRSTDATVLEWLAALRPPPRPRRPRLHLDRRRHWASAAPTAEAASNNAPCQLILLPLISSAFVPLDSMPGWFQPIAEYQPFTPAIEGPSAASLLGTEIGNNWWIATRLVHRSSPHSATRWSKAQFNSDPK